MSGFLKNNAKLRSFSQELAGIGMPISALAVSVGCADYLSRRAGEVKPAASLTAPASRERSQRFYRLGVLSGLARRQAAASQCSEGAGLVAGVICISNPAARFTSLQSFRSSIPHKDRSLVTHA